MNNVVCCCIRWNGRKHETHISYSDILHIMHAACRIQSVKICSDFNHFMYVVILCSEEELPYHNAAADRVSVALCLFVVIDEFPLEEQNLLL